MALRYERRAMFVFAFLRLLFCAYRAGDQSITRDEAYMSQHFFVDPHVLYSIAAKFCVDHFGFSEFNLRLPSLIAGLLLTIGIFELLRLVTRSVLVRWLSFVALCFDPLLLDLSVAARGYGMALAFLVWAMFFAIAGRCFVAGVAAGLALSADLTVAPAIVGICCAVLVLESVSWKDRLSDLAAMIVSAGIIFGLICFRARPSFETGGWIVPGVFASALLALILVFIAVTVVLFLNHAKDRMRVLPVCALAFASASFFAGERAGIYLTVLFAISWAIATDLTPKFRAASLALGVLVTLQFVTQFHATYFTWWQDGSRIKETAGLLTRMSRRRAAGSVKIAASPYHQPALEFYRQRWNILQWAPVESITPAHFTGYDFYVLRNEDLQAMENTGIRILFRDAPSHLILGMNLPAQPAP